MYRLREIEKKDLWIINQWRNDPELISLLGAPFRFINIQVDEKWFDNYMNTRNNAIRCAIVDENDDKILGLVSLVSIDYISRSAELHIMIGNKNDRGKGLGTFAINSILTHAFKNVNLHRVELTVLEDNAYARKLYEKIGFIQEGVKRSAKYKNGRYVNMLLYSILQEEFLKYEAESI